MFYKKYGMVLVANQKKNLNFVPKKGVSIVLFKKKKT